MSVFPDVYPATVPTFWRQFRTQCRVITALLIRDVLVIYGRDGLGAGWVIAEPLTFALPVLALYYLVRGPFEHGVSLVAILWTGYMPLLLFRHIGGASLHIIRSNSGLLYHRDVTLLDIFIARCLLEIAQNIAASLVVYLVFYAIGAIDIPRDFSLLLIGYFFYVWWCIVVGLFIGALSEWASWVDKIWNTYSYTYLFYSGMWWVADWLPSNLRTIALYQPSLQAYEMMRAGQLGDTIQTYYNMGYTAIVLTALSWMGLLLLHIGRKHVIVGT